MKKTLKLIPAICMLMIAAVLVSTATYAWFSMNSQVTATGMQVQAVTEGSLYISKAETKPNYQNIILSTVELPTLVNNKAPELMPTSTINVEDWYTVGAANANAYGKSADAFTKVAAGGAGYYIKKTVWVRSENDFNSLVVNGVTIDADYDENATDEVIGRAVTVAFKVVSYTTPVAEDANTEGEDVGTETAATSAPVFVANEATSARNGGVKRTSASDDTGIIDSTVPGFVAQSDVASSRPTIWTKPEAMATAETSVANYTFQIDIYVYFDGQSTSCYSNALLNAVSMVATIDVSFATADA